MRWAKRLVSLCLVIGSLSLGVVTGCGRADDGLTAEQRATGDRLQEIARKTDGDWNKLSAEERDFLVNKLSYGNEASAKMLLLGAAGKIGGRPGGPPSSVQGPSPRNDSAR